jgi:hypothetical protein
MRSSACLSAVSLRSQLPLSVRPLNFAGEMLQALAGVRPHAGLRITPAIAGGVSGAIIYTGTVLSCAQVKAFFRKMAKDSNGKIKPLQCHGVQGVVPGNSNQDTRGLVVSR